MTSPFREEWFCPSINSFFSQQSVWLQWGRSGPLKNAPHKESREDQSKATSLPSSCQARSPVGIRQSCCHQPCPQRSSLPLGQRGRKVPASPTFQHMMEKRGGFTNHLPSLPQVLHGGEPCLTQLGPGPWTPVHKRSREDGGGSL